MDSYRAHIEHRFLDDANLWEAFEGLCEALIAAGERLDTPLEESPAQMSAQDSSVTLQRATVRALRDEFAAIHVEPHAVGRFFRASGTRSSVSTWLFMADGFRAIHLSVHAESDVWLDSMKGSVERFLTQYPQRPAQNVLARDGVEAAKIERRPGRLASIMLWVGDHVAQIIGAVIVAAVLAWLGLRP